MAAVVFTAYVPLPEMASVVEAVAQLLFEVFTNDLVVLKDDNFFNRHCKSPTLNNPGRPAPTGISDLCADTNPRRNAVADGLRMADVMRLRKQLLTDRLGRFLKVVYHHPKRSLKAELGVIGGHGFENPIRQ